MSRRRMSAAQRALLGSLVLGSGCISPPSDPPPAEPDASFTEPDAAVDPGDGDGDADADAGTNDGGPVEQDAGSCSADAGCDGGEPSGPPGEVVINEIESSDSAGDWVELTNPGGTAIDLSGFRLKDIDDTHDFSVIPGGTVLEPGGFYVIEEAALGFGLGGSDSVRLFDPTGSTVLDSHGWVAHALVTYGRCPDGTGSFIDTFEPTKGTPNKCEAGPPPTPQVFINEVESNGGVPGDWVELYNASTTPADVSGYRFKDGDDTHAFYVLPADTVIAGHGFLVIEEADFGFGLGGSDTARLFDATSATPVDSYTWAAHAPTTYGRCPEDGTGSFVPTYSSSKGGANDCAPPSNVTFGPWPGPGTVTITDTANTFGTNLSGLDLEPAGSSTPGLLWASQNNPSVLFRLERAGALWTPSSGEWADGKTLRYPGDTGTPDAEGVTRADPASSAIYVATERDNDVGAVSRLSVLRFDTAAVGTTLIATHEWNLTADLPATGANAGLETIEWIPDAALTAHGFVDEHLAKPYDPSDYADHAGGLFFVGVEATGAIHAYALDHTSGEFTRVASFASGQPGVMALSFDAEQSVLWAYCDDACGNRATLLAVDETGGSETLGQFVARAGFERPSDMANLGNEGLAVSACSAGAKTAIFADDGETDGHALREATLSCGPLF
jgi:hypothetical protein